MELAVTQLKELSPYGFIEDWYSLSAATGIKTKTLSYVLRNRDEMQTRLLRNGRFVYKSGTYLEYVQIRLMPLIYGLLEHFDHSHIISYIPGKSPQNSLRDCVGFRHQIKFDIKGYYDHIRLSTIQDALMAFGFNKRGARLVGRYSVVKRRIGGTDADPRTISTLQQGSKLSPMLSNIVGHHHIDKPILAYIERNLSRIRSLRFKYIRYSDNVCLFVDGPCIPLDALADFKSFVKTTLRTSGFTTHKWQTIASNHPKRNQNFIGIVLNKQARVDKHLYLRTRSTLFNACIKGVYDASDKYWTNNLWLEYDSVPLCNQTKAKAETFLSVMRGKASYISSINERQGTEVKKLVAAVEICNEFFGGDAAGSWLLDDVFNEVKTSRRRAESVEVYADRLRNICCGVQDAD